MDYEVKDIKTDIIDASNQVPVVIDFWAEWCGPCRTLGPVIEKLAGEAKGRWKLVKVNVDHPENQHLAQQFQIRGIPAVRMIYQGKLLGEFSGALPESEIKKWLANHLPEAPEPEEGPEELLELAMKQGDRTAALEMAKRIHNEEPGKDEHHVRLALLLLPVGLEDASRLMASLHQPEKFEMERNVLATVEHLKQIADGEGSLPDTPGAKLYREGAMSFFDEQFKEAADRWIQVLMTDRALDEDGARKACAALFTMLGDHHPVTDAFRRRFSMALYA